jgi:hypothetical protein
VQLGTETKRYDKMLNRVNFIHSHVKTLTTIVETNNCDFGLIVKSSYLEAKNGLTIRSSSFWKDDKRIVIMAIFIESIYLALNFL